MSGILAVNELTCAYRAAVNGEFRLGRRRTGLAADRPATWEPSSSELVVVVVGCHGGAGASTVALGLASAAGEARVVECCSVAASGLVAASSAELGPTSGGWVQGSRGPVLIERRGDRIDLTRCPVPAATVRPLTVVDCSSDADALTADDGWIGGLVRTGPAVLVARPTVPGLRRLEAAIGLLGPNRVFAVLMGIEKRWPRHVEQALGASSRAVRAAGRLIGLPHDPTLAVNGLTPDPLPAPILTGCASLLTLLKEERS